MPISSGDTRGVLSRRIESFSRIDLVSQLPQYPSLSAVRSLIRTSVPPTELVSHTFLIMACLQGDSTDIALAFPHCCRNIQKQSKQAAGGKLRWQAPMTRPNDNLIQKPVSICQEYGSSHTRRSRKMSSSNTVICALKVLQVSAPIRQFRS